jgi:hypothetical protein
LLVLAIGRDVGPGNGKYAEEQDYDKSSKSQTEINESTNDIPHGLP